MNKSELLLIIKIYIKFIYIKHKYTQKKNLFIYL